MALAAGSQICVITAGANQTPTLTRVEVVQRNVAIFKNIIPEVIKHSPNCVLVIVTNPVDVMTLVAWKMSGLPQHRVIGTGTMLETAR